MNPSNPSCGNTYMHACIPPLLHGSSPALSHPVLLRGAAVRRLLAVTHQGIFKTHLAGVIWLQPWWRQEGNPVHSFGRKKYVSFTIGETSVGLSHLSQRRKTLPRCSYWAEKVTMRYSEVMFPPSACPCSSASLQASQTAKHTTWNSTDWLNTKQGSWPRSLKPNSI